VQRIINCHKTQDTDLTPDNVLSILQNGSASMLALAEVKNF